jgi:hypothetical protein
MSITVTGKQYRRNVTQTTTMLNTEALGEEKQ